MKSGYSNQLTRQIGEHLVVSKLGRLGILATPFAGNVPDYDIIASDTSGRSLPIQVKAINGPSWQFSAASFLEIEFKGNRQVIKGRAKMINPRLICVFVLLKPDEQDEFYIFRKRFLQNHFQKCYKGGIRPRNPKSTHCAIWPKEIIAYRDNWTLITKRFAPIS